MSQDLGVYFEYWFLMRKEKDNLFLGQRDWLYIFMRLASDSEEENVVSARANDKARPPTRNECGLGSYDQATD